MMACNYAAFRFCCATGCIYESDDFNRADTTDLGAKWTETAGDWSIDTNRLKIASASAKVTCATIAPASSLKYLVSVSVTLGTDGDVARVFVDDSAFFAELERITSTCGRLRLYDGAVCKGSVGVALGGYTRLVLCVEAAKIHVGTGGSPMLTVPATPASSIVALGTGACTGTVYFEDFSLSKHADDDATCPACGSEGCLFHSDYGCASGSLSAADYTTTGTWANNSGFLCTADGTLTLAPTMPMASGKTMIVWSMHSVALMDAGVALSFSLGGTATVEVDAPIVGGYAPWVRVRVMKSGVQYGRTYQVLAGSAWYLASVALCWDGTVLSVSACKALSGNSTCEHVGAVEDTIATFAASVTVDLLSAAPMGINSVVASKHADDVATCSWCLAPCTTCAPGTFTNTARVVLANLTSVDYGCACTDVTINMTAASSGCSWTGTATGPCSSGTWTATATVSAVGGGYKLSVSVSTSTGVSALFEKTAAGALPDCSSAYDGDINRVSSAGSLHCTMGSATCDFQSPAP